MSSQINGDATGIAQGHCNEAAREKGCRLLACVITSPMSLAF
jgi:hypothetical protein